MYYLYLQLCALGILFHSWKNINEINFVPLFQIFNEKLNTFHLGFLGHRDSVFLSS